VYHSHLLINVGEDPDRADWDICRRWLRNLYRVHQRLCMAFPSADSGGGDVHQTRGGNGGFLFRIDYPANTERGGRRPVVLVQSASQPNWDDAFGLTKDAKDDGGRLIGDAGFLLAAPPQSREVSFGLDGETLTLSCPSRPDQCCRVRLGDLVRFRLRANPTRRAHDNGKRLRVEPGLEAHADWLTSKLVDTGASPICIETFAPSWAYGWQGEHEPQGPRRMQWWSVLFEGSFRVGNTAALKALLESGIGSAKAFGFGLLSVAPAG